MQIRRFWAVCVAAFALAALTLRADNTSTPAPPPAASSPQTITNKAELKKQADAEAKVRKEAEKKAKAEAEAKKKAEARARKEQQAKAKAQKGKTAQTATNAPAGTKVAPSKPLEGPPLSISAEKEQRLQDLLKRYKADQLTPEQYQKERAQILAEP